MNADYIVRLAQWCGGVLIVIGLLAYFLSGTASITALIPAFLGGFLVLAGFAGKRPGLKRPAAYAALVVALLGFVGSLRGLAPFFTLITGGAVALPFAAVAQTLTAAVCLVFMGLAARSLVRKRAY